MRPHRRQPTRLPCPWDSPGKNTGVGCHFLLQCMKVTRESEVAQSCLTLSDPIVQPSRLLRPWNFPGKSTGVGCQCLLWGYSLGGCKNSSQTWLSEWAHARAHTHTQNQHSWMVCNATPRHGRWLGLAVGRKHEGQWRLHILSAKSETERRGDLSAFLPKYCSGSSVVSLGRRKHHFSFFIGWKSERCLENETRFWKKKKKKLLCEREVSETKWKPW